ncbi:plasmid recombination protein [Pacificibacter sp. AS14]|uniref:plasmid recombination protein n=1 Tax=Pacificibacter sp. AS14 TaxID=3135785 RepID=UPI0031799E01
MSGPQFLHIQSYSRKANKAGQNVQQVLDEAARVPEFSKHVENPEPPNIIYGLTPELVREKHDEMVESGFIEVKLKDGTTARRGIRKDRHTLLTAIASYPLLTKQIVDGSVGRDGYERWIELNMRWLRERFGERLVSVVEHVDEEHPHIHAFILPLDDASCSARYLNPAWASKEDAETLAKDSGLPSKEAVKLGNLAYRARGRELQDQYFNEVGLPAGLTRIGPKRERLSREQWKQRKEQARRDALLLREMSDRVESIGQVEAQLDADADKKALELAEKLKAAEAAVAEAIAAETKAKEVAEMIRARAEVEADTLKQRMRSKLNEQTKRLERQANDLQSARSAFDQEKRKVVRETVLRVASVTARVLIGILTGNVRLDDTQAVLQFDDPKLAHEVERLEIAPFVQKAVVLVSQAWSKLSNLMPEKEINKEREHHAEALKPILRPPSGGMEP